MRLEIVMSRKQTIMMGSSLILITYTITLLFAMQVYPAGQTTVALPTTGSIAATEGIGLYSNLACTTPKTSVEWGELQKGGSSSVTIYIKNEGDSPLTLALTTTEWNPSNAVDYITVNWNYNNQQVNPDQVIPVIITLSVDADAQATNFGVKLFIVGTS
jgi:hypothetical protein